MTSRAAKDGRERGKVQRIRAGEAGKGVTTVRLWTQETSARRNGDERCKVKSSRSKKKGAV